MSSDLYVFDNSFYHQQHSSPEMVISDEVADLNFFTDPFSFFCDSSIDNNIFPSISNPIEHESSSSCIDQFSQTLLSSSPPSYLLENLTLYNQGNNNTPPNNGYHHQDFSSLDSMEVKSEDSHIGFDSCYDQQREQQQQSFLSENVTKYLQRSYSSNSFDGKPSSFLFQPRFDSLMESPIFNNQALNSPENNFFSGQIRRVCSTGDLQNIRTAQKTQRSLSSPLATERPFMEDANFKVGRYSAEERKEKILKYRAKRNQRNFNKTIKYACRKTLADNRPRIRGRFARNDETGEIPKVASLGNNEEDDDLWLDGEGELFMSSSGQHQFQYYGCF